MSPVPELQQLVSLGAHCYSPALIEGAWDYLVRALRAHR